MDASQPMLGVASYWTMLKLSPNGRYQTSVQPVAQQFLQAQFPDLNRLTLDDNRLQQHLFNLPQPEAQLCLRCFVSYAIVSACESLVRQFGTHHRFQLDNLLPLVLDDDAALQPSSYSPLSLHILKTFQAGNSTLYSWAIRCTRQHPDVKQFLLEQGVYLISAWALLNDTKPDHLATILAQFHRWHPAEVQQACWVLTSYRAVYLPDRLQQRQQHGDRTVCSVPTLEQLQRMSEMIQAETQVKVEPNALLKQLQTLAQHIREYRLAQRGGFQAGKSFDEPEIREQLEYQLIEKPDDATTEQWAFLQHYRQKFQIVLYQATATVIQDRMQKVNSAQRRNHFLLALQSYYCQHLSMGEIAAQLGVRGQDTISRLLNLKPLRTDIRHQMLRHLKAIVFQQAAQYITPEQLQNVDQQIQMALDEQLDELMQAEAQRDKTPKGLKQSTTLFSKSLCLYLDQIIAQRQDFS